jgi:putative nucleotidyltransferase with HDIG domain
MEVIERIRKNPIFVTQYRKLVQAEENRAFCKHDMAHFLDVARIAYITNLEQNLGILRQVIYAAAILHDIGKATQYEDGTPHEIAGVELASQILNQLQCFSDRDVRSILRAIGEHRTETPQMSTLGKVLYQSDKLSRACYACPMYLECNWSEEKKNQQITR